MINGYDSENRPLEDNLTYRGESILEKLGLNTPNSKYSTIYSNPMPPKDQSISQRSSLYGFGASKGRSAKE